MGRYYNDFNDIRGSDELAHYGVQGMKWGIRRYANYDGTLTTEGQRKYGTYQNFARSSEGQKMLSQSKGQQSSSPRYTKIQNGVKTKQPNQQVQEQPKKSLSTKQKVAIGATVTAGVVAVTGTVIAIRNHHNMMEYESALGNKAMQDMSAKWRSMSVGDKAKAIASNAKTSWHDRDGAVLDAGTKFHRMETGANAAKAERGVFVTYKPADYDKYKADFVGERLKKVRKDADEALKTGNLEKYNDLMNNTKVTERIMESNKKIVIPSSYDSKKIFMEEVYGKNKSAVSNMLKTEYAMGKQTKANAQTYAECQRLMSKEKLNNHEQQRLYELFNKALGVGARNDQLSDKIGEGHQHLGTVKYFNVLEKHGFGAVKDVNDRKLGNYKADAPLIILDRNHTMQDKGKDVVRNIGYEERKIAQLRTRTGKDFIRKGFDHVERFFEGTNTNSSAGRLNFSRDSKQNKLAEALYTKRTSVESKFGKGLTVQQHLQAEALAKSLGTSTDSALSSIYRKMQEGNMSFDEARRSFQENVKERAKPNVPSKVTETVKKATETVSAPKTETKSILSEVRYTKQNLASAIKSDTEKQGKTEIDELIAQLSSASKGGNGKGSSFKKAAQDVNDLTAELLKSNRRRLK